MIHLQGQFSERNAIYLTNQLQIGNYFGISSGLNYVLDERYSLEVGYSGLIRKAERPDDFSPGLLGIFAFGAPFDVISSIHLMAGRVIPINENRRIRWNLSAGLAYSFLEEPVNWRPYRGAPVGANYTYDIAKSRILSVVIRPQFEIPFTRVFGISIGPMILLNTERAYFGLGVGNMLGLLRGRIE